MSALDIDLSEFVGRSAKLSYIVHGVMNAVEAADGQADPLDELADRIRAAAPLAPLLAQRHWVIWRYEGRNGGKLSKVPHVASNPGRTASSKQSHDWCAFESAIAAAKQHGFDGVSFALTETATTKFAAFDLDDCRNCETGEIVPWAQCLVEEAGSYAEITPSGTGLNSRVAACFFNASSTSLRSLSGRYVGIQPPSMSMPKRLLGRSRTCPLLATTS